MTESLERRIDLDDPRTVAALDEVSLWASRFGALFLDNLPLSPGQTILDLGCGTGFPLLDLAGRLGRSCRLVGADIWRAGLERAAAKCAVYDLGNVALVRGDGARLPFRDATFDAVVSNLGINNFADPAATVEECGRVTKRGGLLALTTNPKGHMAEFYALYRDVLRETGRTQLLPALDREEDHRPERAAIARLLEQGGFAVLRTVEDGLPMRYLDGAAFLEHVLTRIGFLDGWLSFVPAEEQQPVLVALQAALDARARNEGELLLRVPMLYVEARRS